MSEYKRKYFISFFLKSKKNEIESLTLGHFVRYFHHLVEIILEKTKYVNPEKIPRSINNERILRKWEVDFINDYVSNICSRRSLKYAQALMYKINDNFPQNSLYVKTPRLRDTHIQSLKFIPSYVPLYSQRGYYILALITKQGAFKSFSGSKIYEKHTNKLILSFLI